MLLLFAELRTKDDWILRFILCISASAADAIAVNPKGIKTLLANDLIKFLLNVALFLVMDQVVYQENPPDRIILDN